MARKQDGTSKEPGRWYHEEMWRGPLNTIDQDKALLLRSRLYADYMLPPADVADDPHRNAQEANERAALRDVIEELPRAELFAVWQVARLLLLSAPEAGEHGPLFAYARELAASNG